MSPIQILNIYGMILERLKDLPKLLFPELASLPSFNALLLNNTYPG